MLSFILKCSTVQGWRGAGGCLCTDFKVVNFSKNLLQEHKKRNKRPQELGLFSLRSEVLL